MDKIQPQLAKLDNYLSQYKFLSDIEKKSCIPKVYLVLSLSFLLGLSIVFDILAAWTVGALSLIYPFLNSCKAILKSDAKATKTWLLYFSIISIWSFLELGDFLYNIIPYYYTIKSIVIIWLITPNFMVILLFYLLYRE